MLALEFRLHLSNNGFNAFPERPIFMGMMVYGVKCGKGITSRVLGIDVRFPRS